MNSFGFHLNFLAFFFRVVDAALTVCNVWEENRFEEHLPVFTRPTHSNSSRHHRNYRAGIVETLFSYN